MEPILIPMGEFMVTNNPTTLTCIGLGSCVGVTLYDPALKLGALAHIVLPTKAGGRSRSGSPDKKAKFADSAIRKMIEGMEKRGSQRGFLEAKVFGGANMFPNVPGTILTAIGERNVRAVRKELEIQGIRIAAQDVGGHQGRTIFFDLCSGAVRVRSVQREERIY